jgi:NADH:ubiquinone oxidoreductase subunit 3 (subunit A)
MKRKVKNESIIIAILIILIIAVAAILITVLMKKNKAEKAKKESNIVCGETETDRAKALCNRYFEKGYIVTFKDGNDLNAKYEAINTLMINLKDKPVVYVSAEEQLQILENQNIKTNNVKLDDVLFVPDYDLKYETLVEAVKKDERLDKVYKYSGLVEENK